MGLSLWVGALTLGLPVSAQDLRVPPSQRWLEVQQLSGSVIYRGQQRRPARVGDRLQAVGQGIDTGSRSTSSLSIDTGIGVVNVAENSSLSVRGLSILGNGARVTLLSVTRGQARLQVRRFTHPDSRLEVETPAGVAAVRGTDFGVSVNTVGKTSVATLEGAVEASAQGESVLVEPGYVSIIIPGQPPSLPRLLDRVNRFNVISLRRTSGRVLVSASIDPANVVFVNGQEIDTDAEGRFRTTVTAQANRQLQVLVRNPVGEERTYQIPVR